MKKSCEIALVRHSEFINQGMHMVTHLQFGVQPIRVVCVYRSGL
jgi:hypothetical protein